jgi:hypothetical protein
LRLGTLPLKKLSAKTRLLRLVIEETDDGIFPYKKFEEILKTSSDLNLLIFEGNVPHKPSDTNDKTFIFESFVKIVKKDSIENLCERLLELQETGLVLFCYR